MNGLKDCHASTWHPALRRFRSLKFSSLFVFCHVPRYQVEPLKLPIFIVYWLKQNANPFFQYHHRQQCSKRRLVELLLTFFAFSLSCLVSNLRYIEPALLNHFTNSCPSALTYYLESKIDPSKQCQVYSRLQTRANYKRIKFSRQLGQLFISTYRYIILNATV